jgi:acyl-CoA hydrolase
VPPVPFGTNCIAAAADNLVARNGDRIRVTYADFTYVALDEAGRPRPVPSKPAA